MNYNKQIFMERHFRSNRDSKFTIKERIEKKKTKNELDNTLAMIKILEENLIKHL